MNLDRALAILGVIVGVLGAAAGVYVSQKDYNMGLLLASGWVAAALIGLTICTLAFRAITAMERTHAQALKEVTEARIAAEQRYAILRQESTTLNAEVAEFRNISRALSAVVNGEDKPTLPRAKTRRGKASGSQSERANQEQAATE